MKTNDKFVSRIADTYLDVYKKHGFVEAKEYAERVIGDNKPLQKAVKAKADAKIAALVGKKGGPTENGA